MAEYEADDGRYFFSGSNGPKCSVDGWYDKVQQSPENATQLYWDGKVVEQEQKEISRNHFQRLYCSQKQCVHEFHVEITCASARTAKESASRITLRLPSRRTETP